MSNTLAEQTNNAFEFVRKLYLEISYLIKETETLLHEENEEFVIGKPSGYSVTTRTSAGLEPINVDLWLNKTFTVFFCSQSATGINAGQGQTVTHFTEDLKLILLHIKLIEKGMAEPQIFFGTIKDIKCKNPAYDKKFEKLMWLFAARGEKIFNTSTTEYEDTYISFTSDFAVRHLYDIKSSADIKNMIVEPALESYRSL